MVTETKKFASKKEADVFARELSLNPSVSSVVTKPSGEAVITYRSTGGGRSQFLSESEATLKAQLSSRDLTEEQRRATELELSTVQTSLGKEPENMGLVVYPTSKTAEIATAEYNKQRIENAMTSAEKAGYVIPSGLKQNLMDQASEDPRHKLFFSKESAGGLEMGFRPAVSSNETSLSPEKALKMNLITEDQYNEAKAKNLIFIAKTSELAPRPEETPEDLKKRIDSGDIYVYIEVPQWVRNGLAKGVISPSEVLKYSLQWGNVPKVTSNTSEIPQGSRVFRSDEVEVKKGQLYVHDLPVWLEAKLESEAYLEYTKRKGIRQQYEEMPTKKRAFVAVRTALTDYGAPIELAILKVQKKTDEYNERLTDVLVEQAGFEKNKKGALIRTFTRGVGLTAISAPIGMGLQASINTVTTASKALGNIINTALLGTGLVGAGIMTYPYVKNKKWAELGGEITVLLGAVAGAVHGSMVANKLRMGMPEPQQVTLKPEKAIIHGEYQREGKITYRSDTIDVKTNMGDVHDITYDGKIIKGDTININGETIKSSTTYHEYDVPEQIIRTPKGEDLLIRHQKLYISEQDYTKIQASFRNPALRQKITFTEGRKVSVERQFDNIIKNNLDNADRSFKFSNVKVNEITATDITGAVTKFSRYGTIGGPEEEVYGEAGVITRKGIIAKGVSAKPEYNYEYAVLEKKIMPTDQAYIDNFNRANENIGRVVDTNSKTSTKTIDTALEQLEKARLLKSAEIGASINTGNVGRISYTGAIAVTKPEPVEKKSESVKNFMGIVDTAINQAVGMTRIKKEKKESVFITPSVRSTQISVGGIEKTQTNLPTKAGNAIDLYQRQVTEQIQAVLQKQEQKTRVLQRALIRSRTGTGKFNIRETPIEIKRGGRIPPTWWDYYASLGAGATNIDTSLRTIRHRLIEASRLI